ncbi:MAG: hypothetical protein WCA81_17870 [Rhizomicrobium sp.]
MRGYRGILFWLLVVLAIVVLLNLYPKIGAFPAIVLLAPAVAILLYRIWHERAAKTLSLENSVWGPIRSKHLFQAAIASVVALFIWLFVEPATVSDNPFLTEGPTIGLILFAGVAVGIGLYTARRDVR